MTQFTSYADITALCARVPAGRDKSAAAVAARQEALTKPLGSLGRMEALVAWLAGWQRRDMPMLGRVETIIFAGNHGVVAQGVSPFPPEVTAQMVHNFASGGAAINQIARVAGSLLRVIPIRLDEPTADITTAPAMDEAAFVEAFTIGFEAVSPATDLLCLGEMGIGNTTVAAALACGLFGGSGADWAGRGSGVDDAGLRRKQSAIDRAVALHQGASPVELAARLGGRELAAIFGATLAARVLNIPVLLDGFVSTAAAAPLGLLSGCGFGHVEIGHASAETGHRRLLAAIGKQPILDLGMRLGEASGAATAILILRAALACHSGMATFAEAAVSGKTA
ncbi:MAG: nicotinate-nucleotide--dimethylbenzimidazole phosphoribosyltransferase [Acetobacteraceae bacterium]|nr:nicotinate-nucleotide--dimethylbenzimidazole phosphoribosyltransferase [Acetobacteraceae bacterium]